MLWGLHHERGEFGGGPCDCGNDGCFGSWSIRYLTQDIVRPDGVKGLRGYRPGLPRP